VRRVISAASRSKMWLAALAQAAGLWATPSLAGTIEVNSGADTVAYDGGWTLREAVLSANADLELDDCTGASGFDTLIIEVAPLLSSNATIEISSGIMLQGANYPLLQPITGMGSHFLIDQAGTLELSDVRLTQFSKTAIVVQSGWAL